MITSFNLSLDSSVEDLCGAASAAGIDAKSRNELVWSFEAVSRWNDELQKRFGDLMLVDHHSPPDDPPDLLLHFPNLAVPLEHTLLKPYPLGWADAIRGSRSGFVPPVTTRSWTRADLQDLISGADDVWASVSETYPATFRELTAAVEKKLTRLPAGGIIVVDDRVTADAREREALVKGLRAQSIFLAKHTVIFFQRNNPLQFWSAFLTADELIIRQSEI